VQEPKRGPRRRFLLPPPLFLFPQSFFFFRLRPPCLLRRGRLGELDGSFSFFLHNFPFLSFGRRNRSQDSRSSYRFLPTKFVFTPLFFLFSEKGPSLFSPAFPTSHSRAALQDGASSETGCEKSPPEVSFFLLLLLPSLFSFSLTGGCVAGKVSISGSKNAAM